MFPPWKIEAPVISPGPCISNSHRVTFVGRRKKRTLEMTYAYYVCATVIDDETATLQHTHTGFFISSSFSGPSTKGPIWFRWPVTKHKKSWCVYVALCLVPWVCVCVCVHILLSPHHFLSLGCAPASYRRPPPSIHRQWIWNQTTTTTHKKE